jgi:CspA family cold shock protein
MPRGRIAWYSVNLGHGFIIPEDGGPKPFVRREDIKAGEEETLEDNHRVSYEVFEGPDGLEAKGVHKVSEQ